MPFETGWKRLDVFGRKAYSLVTLQFRIMNYHALMVKYDHMNFTKFDAFIDHLPEAQWEQFQAIIHEGQLVVIWALQTTLDAADTMSYSVLTTVVMYRGSRLHLSRLLKEVQKMVEDLPFKGSKLFANKTGASLYSLKASRATLCSLGICTSGQKRKFSPQSFHGSRPPQYPPLQHYYEPQRKRAKI